MIPKDEQPNYETFRDCLSNAIIRKLTIRPPKERRRAKRRKGVKGKAVPCADFMEISCESGGNDVEELGEFVDVYDLQSQIFWS
jgi:hypothetical protein